MTITKRRNLMVIGAQLISPPEKTTDLRLIKLDHPGDDTRIPFLFDDVIPWLTVCWPAEMKQGNILNSTSIS